MSLEIVVGGQFGSEAKGAVTAAICASESTVNRTVFAVRIGGPNAGHSAYDQRGRKWALRQVPAGMVVSEDVQGVIADGSEVDPEVLLAEIEALEDAGIEIRDRLTVSDEATVITDDHRRREQVLVGAIGSTGKGIGAARADRILRSGMRYGDLATDVLEQIGAIPAGAGELGPELTSLSGSDTACVVIEGVQGYGLGLHAGYYPQCTSVDARAIDFLAAAGINPWGLQIHRDLNVHVVVRPYPIRVAGNSGPLKGERTWAELGLEPELTTVTKKVRRVGEWDAELAAEAVRANGPGAWLAVSMLDQLPGATEPSWTEGERRVVTEKGWEWVRRIEEQVGARVSWFGTGPTLDDWCHA